MRSSHSRESGWRKTARRPPHTSSSSVAGLRIEGGQLSSSQRRVSRRKASSVIASLRGASRAPRLRHVEREVLDHVLLPTDGLAPPHLDEQIARGDSVL